MRRKIKRKTCEKWGKNHFSFRLRSRWLLLGISLRINLKTKEKIVWMIVNRHSHEYNMNVKEEKRQYLTKKKYIFEYNFLTFQ